MGVSILLLLCGVCSGHAAAPQLPSFEVASVRPAPPFVPGQRMSFGPRGGPGTADPERWTLDNMTLASLVTIAYNIKGYQLTAPAWTNADRFNIIAKVPAGTTKEQAQLMMQNLLIERFGLKIHHESKEMAVYDLVLGKNGHKMKEYVEPTTPNPDFAMPGPLGRGRIERDADGYPIIPAGRSATIMEMGKARWQALGETVDAIARRLSGELGRPVTNSTGLSGKFEFTLSWIPAPPANMMGVVMMPSMMPSGPPPPPPPGAAGPDGAMPSANMPDGPTLTAAIQQQLGLKVESKRAMIDTIVIDHAEKVPTEN